MFDLKVASIGIRKACALRGIRTATWEVFEGSYDPTLDPMGCTKVIARIHPARGEMFMLTVGDVMDAEDYTWKEIRDSP